MDLLPLHIISLHIVRKLAIERCSVGNISQEGAVYEVSKIERSPDKRTHKNSSRLSPVEMDADVNAGQAFESFKDIQFEF